MTTTSDPIELFLPEPAPREVKYTLISVDDHLMELYREGRITKDTALEHAFDRKTMATRLGAPGAD